ncbi:MAG: hypothetical protein DWQ19_10305 [Crenarchaeota archaeon]|nr:MAG: hypothetical protein DWQ19_10305 [Thermoproteota archaeon]
MEINFKEWLLAEMPINKFELLGKWGPNDRPRGYNRQDIGILTNPKAVDKIHRQWSNTKQKFDLYFLRAPKAKNYREIGEVSPEWVKENLDIDIQPNPETITIIFTQNTGAEKVPMTGWIIAHRIGHALYMNRAEGYSNGPLMGFFQKVQRDFKQMTQRLFGSTPDQYGQYSRYQATPAHLAMAVGTMKSAKDRKLFRFSEFAHELFAQYLITGKIKFNPLPRNILMRNHMAWGHHAPQTRWIRDEESYEHVSNRLEELEYEYEYELDYILEGLEGSIFVM